MDKKEFLIRILVQLEPVRNLAKWLEILVQEWNLGDDILDILINAVQWAVNSAQSELAKNKLQKWLDALQKMKEMEEKSRLEDEKDLVELERMLENI